MKSLFARYRERRWYKQQLALVQSMMDTLDKTPTSLKSIEQLAAWFKGFELCMHIRFVLDQDEMFHNLGRDF